MNRIISNYIYSLIYQIITVAIPFITIPYLTRVLGPSNLGIESYVLSIVAIFVAVGTIGTNTFAIREVANSRENQKKLKQVSYDLIFLRIISGILIILLYSIFAATSEYDTFFKIALIYIIAGTIIDTNWFFAGLERFKTITLRNLLTKVIGLIAILLFVKEKEDLIIYIIINGLTILLPNIIFSIILVREIGLPNKENISFKALKKLISRVVPFFFLTITIQFYMNIDKIILEYSNYTYELGIYSQYLKTFTFILAPITAIGTILLPYVSNLYSSATKEKDLLEVVKISSNLILLLGIPFFVVMMIISNDFTRLYFGEVTKDYLSLFRIGCLLIITGSLMNIVIQQIVFPKLQEKRYLRALIIASLVRVVTIVILLNTIGINGAIISYLISEVIIIIYCVSYNDNFSLVYKAIINSNTLKIIISALSICIISVLNVSVLYQVISGCIFYCFFLIVLKEKIASTIISFVFKKIKS